MANIEPNLPLFFNMHSTSHSGYLTSFSSLSDYNIFVEDKPDKVSEGRWHSKWCYILGGMDDRVPWIWTLFSKAKRPIFARSIHVKAQIALLQEVFQDSWDYKVFCEEGVLIQAGIIRSKEFDSSVEPPVTWVEPMVHASSSKGQESDFARKDSATRPLLLEEIGKPYEEYIDTLELQGVIAKHLVRAMNVSHVLARRVARLDVDLGPSRESERASRFKVEELEKENEDL
ncbi:hypothetical protein LIER_19954 [Lithospermum erythrorhizon]|uniref:Uncharacterized protein n=1 Tax=Lithospermum erythrorhizon TaxID=34254 RepID=A0AAV3QMD0_LITER